MMSCDRCGHVFEIGDWPFCPHGRSSLAVHGDALDYIDENLGPHPIHIRSKAQRQHIMKERGLEEFVRHAPLPGTDKSPHTTDWSRGSMDPYTLHAAQDLVSRGRASAQEPDSPDFVVREGRALQLTEGTKVNRAITTQEALDLLK